MKRAIQLGKNAKGSRNIVILTTCYFALLQGGDVSGDILPGQRDVKQQPSEYEQPLIKKDKAPATKAPRTSDIKEESPSNSNYDTPEGVEGLPLDHDIIQVSSTHALKLPADYDEIDDTVEYQNLDLQNGIDSNYHLLDSASLSPTSPKFVPLPTTDKSKTWAPSASDNYETPLDANMVGTAATLPAPPGNCGDNYEVPFDAST